MGIHNWTLCVLVLIVLMEPVSSDKVTACSTQSICITFAVDRTVNINGIQQQQMVHFIQDVIATTPEDSEGHLIYVNKERNKVATFVVENQTATYTYFYGLEDWEPTGYIISAIALEQEVNVCFNTSGYKLDVFFLLVSDLTKLQSISPELLWKETFVIVFGSHIPNEFQRLASSEDHTHLIKDSDDVTTAVNIVSKQICKDILFPYIHVPDVEVIPKETDSGERAFYFVLGGVCIGIIISFLVLILCRKKKLEEKEMVLLVGYKMSNSEIVYEASPNGKLSNDIV